MNDQPIAFSFSANQIQQLKKNPERTIVGRMGPNPFEAHIAIAHHDKHIEKEYAEYCPSGLKAACDRIGLPFTLNHFGLKIKFTEPVMIHMYDENMAFDENARQVVTAFGPVIMENAYLPERNRSDGHNAKFAHLNFHRDRGSHQAEQVSIYLRDPFDEIQSQPRTISTLFMASIVAHFQNLREDGEPEPGNEGRGMRYHFFKKVEPSPLLGNVILEQSWTAPVNTGEICVIDNEPILHSSYYRTAARDGYKIGVRYLI